MPDRLRIDRRIIGWPLLVTSFVVFLVDTYPFLGGTELDGSGVERAGVVLRASLVAHLVIAGLLLLGRFTWMATRWARRHPSVTIGTFFVAALLGDSVFQGSIAANSDGRYEAGSLVDHVLYDTAALVILAILISELNDYRRQTRRLQHTLGEVTAARHEAARVEQQERASVAHAVAESIAEARSAVGRGDLHQAVEALRSLNADRVRPLSHALASATPDFSPPPLELPPTPSWRATLRQVVDAPLIAPRVMAVAMTLLGFRQTVTSQAQTPPGTIDGPVAVTFDAEPLIEAVSVLVALYLVTYVVARLAARVVAERTTGWTLGRRAAANAVGIVAMALVSLGLLAAAFQLPWFPEPPSAGAWTPFLTLVPLGLIAVVHGLARSIARHRQAVLERLTDATCAVQWELAAINERLWHHRRVLAHGVHGPVQAAINAAALRLGDLARKEADATEGAEAKMTVMAEVDEVLGQCGTALAAAHAAPVPLAAELDEIVALWRGVCDITVDVPAEVVDHLGHDPACASAVVAIVGEACTNAAQHGRARHVSVVLTAVDPRTLRLTVTDDGSGVEPTGEPGLGSQLLDEVSLGWSRVSSSGGTTLTVDLPVRVRATA